MKDELYKKIIEKQDELISMYKNGISAITWSGIPYQIKEVTILMNEIASLKSELEKEEITDADIEAWANDNQFNDGLTNCVDILIYGAKAALTGKIKHIQ